IIIKQSFNKSKTKAYIFFVWYESLYYFLFLSSLMPTIGSFDSHSIKCKPNICYC
ncbi:hypothetical protein GIB67_012327, partial [Kingdonia uniflora]